MSQTRFSPLFSLSHLLLGPSFPNVNQTMDQHIRAEKARLLKKFDYHKLKLQGLRETLNLDHKIISELLEVHLIPCGIQMHDLLDPARSEEHKICLHVLHKVIKQGRILAQDMEDHLRLLVVAELASTITLADLQSSVVQLKHHVAISAVRVQALQQRFKTYRHLEFFKQLKGVTGGLDAMIEKIIEMVKSKHESPTEHSHHTRSKSNSS